MNVIIQTRQEQVVRYLRCDNYPVVSNSVGGMIVQWCSVSAEIPKVSRIWILSEKFNLPVFSKIFRFPLFDFEHT